MASVHRHSRRTAGATFAPMFHTYLSIYTITWQALLPPKTAQMYAQLLKAENIELSRGRGATWKRIIEIRHLKDRMIRKCQRISRVSAPAPPGTPFRDLYAPNDFRLKEMEKWLKMEGFSVSTAEGNAKYTTETIRARSHSPHSTHSSSTHAQPAQVHAPTTRSSRQGQVSRSSVSQRISTRASVTVRRRSSASSQSTVQSPSPAHSRTSSETQTHRHGAYQGPSSSARAAHLSPVVEEGSTITSSRLTNPHDPSIEQRVEEPPTRPDVISPDPLPRLYRPPSTNLQTAPVDMPHPVTEMPIPRPVPPPEPHMAYEGSEFSSIPPSLPSKGHYEPASYAEFQDALNEGPSRPTLPRRRSSLKQSDGRMGSGVSQKVVSWAMDRDWSDHMSKYDQILYATEIAGKCPSHSFMHRWAKIICRQCLG